MAVLSAHGDDHGVVLPPNIAPVQVVVIPIPYREKEECINKVCKDIGAKLRKAEVKVELDWTCEQI